METVSIYIILLLVGIIIGFLLIVPALRSVAVPYGHSTGGGYLLILSIVIFFVFLIYIERDSDPQPRPEPAATTVPKSQPDDDEPRTLQRDEYYHMIAGTKGNTAVKSRTVEQDTEQPHVTNEHTCFLQLSAAKDLANSRIEQAKLARQTGQEVYIAKRVDGDATPYVYKLVVWVANQAEAEYLRQELRSKGHIYEWSQLQLLD